MNRLASEIAESTRTAHGTHVAPSFSNALIEIAKRLQRLQSRRKTLRKTLKQTETDIRVCKRELKALAQQIGRGE